MTKRNQQDPGPEEQDGAAISPRSEPDVQATGEAAPSRPAGVGTMDIDQVIDGIVQTYEPGLQPDPDLVERELPLAGPLAAEVTQGNPRWASPVTTIGPSLRGFLFGIAVALVASWWLLRSYQRST